MIESDGPTQASRLDDLVGKVMSRLLQDGDDVAADDPLDYLQRITAEVDSEWQRQVPLAADAHLTASVETAYGALPNGQRQMLRMHVHDGLSYTQIGQRTGLGASGALSALVRSYSALLTAWSGASWAQSIGVTGAVHDEVPPTRSGALEEEVFTAALALPASERDRYLVQVCEGEPALHALVSALLRGFERRIGSAARLAAMRVEGVGDCINNFELLEEIGEGGCGVVFLAQQVVPLRREVALKVIKQGMDTRAVIARFEGERQTLAMMDHPNIARVFDAGATPSGRPFFVMELVRGIKITDFCSQTRLSISDRLALVVQVCHAIQHAHQRAVIHRDIKPSNVLVTLCDGVPTVKVIDFGIAKAMQGRMIDRSFLTAVEQFVGTPTYTSPEQTGHGDVDARSDIFSLGVLLYELLTGYTPLDVSELTHVGMDEVRRRIRSEDPLRPSKRLRMLDRSQLDKVAERYRTTGQKLIRKVQGDLEWIVMRCLEKDPAQRYQSVTAMRLDIEHYLRDEPVTARPPGIASTFARFARRHRTVFAIGATIIAILVAATAIATWFALREARANRISQQVIGFLQNDFLFNPRENGANPATIVDEDSPFQNDLKLSTMLGYAESKLRKRFADQAVVEGQIRETLGFTYELIGEHASAIAQWERVLVIDREQFGSADERTLAALRAMVRILTKQKGYTKAEALGEPALDLHRSALGEIDAGTLSLAATLGVAYFGSGKYAQAEELLALVTRHREVLGASDRQVLISLSTLAEIHLRKGELGKAETFALDALSRYRTIRGAVSSEAIAALLGLQRIYVRMGKQEEAARLLVEAQACEECFKPRGCAVTCQPQFSSIDELTIPQPPPSLVVSEAP